MPVTCYAYTVRVEPPLIVTHNGVRTIVDCSPMIATIREHSDGRVTIAPEPNDRARVILEAQRACRNKQHKFKSAIRAAIDEACAQTLQDRQR